MRKVANKDITEHARPNSPYKWCVSEVHNFEEPATAHSTQNSQNGAANEAHGEIEQELREF